MTLLLKVAFSQRKRIQVSLALTLDPNWLFRSQRPSFGPF